MSYQYSIAEIAENFVALLGLKDSLFGNIVFLEEHAADGLGSFGLELDCRSAHLNFGL